jgi:cardiolipin synthase
LLVSTYVILPIIGLIPSWLTVIVVSRDVIIASGYLILYLTWGSSAVEVSRLGKLSTFTQSFGAGFFMLAALVPILGPGKLIVVVLVAGLTAASGVVYIIQGIYRASLLAHRQAGK